MYFVDENVCILVDISCICLIDNIVAVAGSVVGLEPSRSRVIFYTSAN